MGLSQMVSEFL